MISNELKVKYDNKHYFPKAIIRDSDGVRYLLQMWNGNHIEVNSEEVEIVKWI